MRSLFCYDVKNKDTQTGLGCIKCSRCFIGVGFIYLTHMFTKCVFFNLLNFNPFSHLCIDPAWDRWPFTGLQHIHAHRPGSDPRCKDSSSPLTTTQHTSPHHTNKPCSDRNLKALVGVLRLLGKNLCVCCLHLRIASWKTCENNRNQTKYKKRDRPLSNFLSPQDQWWSLWMSLLSSFSMCFLLFHLNSV